MRMGMGWIGNAVHFNGEKNLSLRWHLFDQNESDAGTAKLFGAFFALREIPHFGTILV